MDPSGSIPLRLAENILNRLKALLISGKSPQDTLPILEKCISTLTDYHGDNIAEQASPLIETLLASVIKPLFSSTATSSVYGARFLEDPPKRWKESAPWSVDILKWVQHHYGSLAKPPPRQAIEAQFLLLVPPVLSLLDDEDIMHKRTGCDLLRAVCDLIVSCGSPILQRTGLAKALEDSLAPNMLLLPSLTPEEQSLEILSSLYPAYRALVNANFSTTASTAPLSTGMPKLVAPTPHSISGQVLKQHSDRQAMLDRVLRNGILAGYIHASDYVQIATLLVTEMSYLVAMMGASSAKYLYRLLPLLRNILTNPMGTAYQPLLKSAVVAMRQLILQCWPRIAEVWWEECLRAIVGLWLLLSEENNGMTQELKGDAKGVMELLLQLEGHSDARKNLYLLRSECEELEGLLPTG